MIGGNYIKTAMLRYVLRTQCVLRQRKASE